MEDAKVCFDPVATGTEDGSGPPPSASPGVVEVGVLDTNPVGLGGCTPTLFAGRGFEDTGVCPTPLDVGEGAPALLPT